jgi:5-methylcytosine-specific restriction endonuclease McrA
MSRHEFSKPIRREALRRSGGLCEAIGAVYGLEPGHRCNAPLSHGVEFDHYPVPATDPGSDTLDNCVACCKTCHRHKTSTYDVPMQAKGKRVRDKHNGIRPTSRLRSGGFAKRPPQRTASRPFRTKEHI